VWPGPEIGRWSCSGVLPLSVFTLKLTSSMPRTCADTVAKPFPQRTPPNLLTLISVAAFASALVGLVRQVLGYAIATRFVAAGWVSASAAFAQVNSPTRLAGAFGTLTTLLLGGVASILIRMDKRLTGGWYFLWVFGCVSFMNSGRLLYSAITNTGEWSVVLASFQSPWIWRLLIAIVGLYIYRPALHFAVNSARELIEARELAYRDLWLLVFTAYFTASAVLTAGAVFNPVNNGVVVLAVAAASFGLNLGLLVIPAFISEPVESEIRPNAISFSWLWLIMGAAACAAFLGGVGRAIRF